MLRSSVSTLSPMRSVLARGWQAHRSTCKSLGVPLVAQWVKNPASIHEDVGSVPGLTQWVKDLVLLGLWHRLAAAALIQPRTSVCHRCGPKQKKKKKVCPSSEGDGLHKDQSGCRDQRRGTCNGSMEDGLDGCPWGDEGVWTVLRDS